MSGKVQKQSRQHRKIDDHIGDHVQQRGEKSGGMQYISLLLPGKRRGNQNRQSGNRLDRAGNLPVSAAQQKHDFIQQEHRAGDDERPDRGSPCVADIIALRMAAARQQHGNDRQQRQKQLCGGEHRKHVVFQRNERIQKPQQEQQHGQANQPNPAVAVRYALAA